MIFVGYRNDRFFCPYKSLSFECYIYAKVPIFLFLAWATCGIMAATLTNKIHKTLIGDRTTKLNTLVFINCLQKCCIAFEVLIKQTICLQKLCLKYFSKTHHSWFTIGVAVANFFFEREIIKQVT